LPDLPTTAEAGYAKVNSDNWYGLVAPAGLPAEVSDRLHRAAIAALNKSELKKQFATLNAVADPMTPQQFAAFIRAEQAKWGPVVAKTGVRLD
jgi:tripartite-type tricarboxylate transporter receptor subunit TctC